MMKSKNRTTLVLILMTFVCIVTTLRSYYRVPSGDELFYQYVWEESDPTILWAPGHKFERKVESLKDVLQTQKIHYMAWNGRALVHTVEQCFTGHEVLFSVVNALMFVLMVWLIVNYSVGKTSEFLIWIVTVCVLLWMLPYRESLWISINYAPNYLWSATLGMGVLCLLKRIFDGKVVNKYLAALIGLLFGWTHEGFVVTIAGGIFLNYCFNFKQWKGTVCWLTIPMWITSALLIFAPGNFARYFGKSASDTNGVLISLANAIDNLTHLWLINILLLIGLLYVIFGKRRAVALFISQNAMLFVMLAIGFVFSLIANTAPYSHVPTELICLIILLRLLSRLKLSKVVQYCVSVILSVAFVVWGVLVVKDTIANYRTQKVMLDQYITSPDGLVEAIEPPTSWLTHDDIRTWEVNERLTKFYVGSWNSVLFQGNKIPYLLNSADYKALQNPDSIFRQSNELWPGVPVYRVPGGENMWIDLSKIDSESDLVAHFKPVHWSDEGVPALVRIKFLLQADSYPSTGKVPLAKVPLPNSRDSIGLIEDFGLRKLDSIRLITKK